MKFLMDLCHLIDGLNNLKTNKMKTVLLVASGISTGLSIGAIWTGEIDRAILFLVWAFYLRYLSDQNK